MEYAKRQVYKGAGWEKEESNKTSFRLKSDVKKDQKSLQSNQ